MCPRLEVPVLRLDRRVAPLCSERRDQVRPSWRPRDWRANTRNAAQGACTLPNGLVGPEAARVLRWMEDSPAVFEGVRRILDACDQATEAARVAQTERERLQQECEALREQVRQLHAELVRLKKERADASHWVATMLQEAAARFPTTPAPV